ncbi:uncharacterized protein [Watersipora subatra]|uniref:uncharacterized protein n=1 Tax=Watersipora subatra TaxID=2589382 RepID=UPI00355B4E06
MIMQRACKESQKWDDDVPEDIANDWNRWKSQLDELQDISIPRCLTPGLASNFKNWKYTELHHFCDASLEGYGACSYLRLVDSNDQVHTALIMAKSRVAPLKSMTIPRLELQAAVEAARLKCQLESELDMAVDTQYIWTDSTATLGFINSNEAKFHMFVANRVAEIRRCSSVTQWHHVPGSVNPADLASRGCTLSALKKSNWFTGPAFLRKLDLSAHLANKADYCEFIQNSVEVKKPKQVLSTQSATNDTLDEIVKRFSSWTRLVRAITNAKAMLQNKSFKRPATTAEDLCQAESHIIKLDQKQAFDKEISQLEKKETLQKNSKIRKLVPYLDENNMLRMSSRTTSPLSYRERNPIILSKSRLTKLLVTHYHQITHHQGHNSAITALRQAGYWITGVSTLAKGIVHRCVKCRINRARLEEQQMGLLPKERTEPSPPFTHVGIDTFGHFFVQDRRTELKRWGVIFTCLYTRAIHIELIDDLSTDSFLQALRRFQAVRGPVTTVFSDAGTNFVGGRNQMEQDLLNMRSKELKDYLMTKKIKFETNTPTASHQGGVWERQIRTIRSILQGMSLKYSKRMTTESLRTAFYEIMATVNSRPISTDSLSDTDAIITANHLLTMKSQHFPPPPGEFDSAEIYGRLMYRKSQQLAEEFWTMWKAQYLTKIEGRSKWENPKQNIKVGDIVIIVDNNEPRNQWKTGSVIATHQGPDGLVRKTTVMLGTKDLNNAGKPNRPRITLDRPVQKLIKLMSAENRHD